MDGVEFLVLQAAASFESGGPGSSLRRGHGPGGQKRLKPLVKEADLVAKSSCQGVVYVALSGNLGFVPLDEVLRLLMRSDQRGSVEVRGEDIRGRVFVGKKGIALATTAEDRDLHKHLVNSGYVDDEFLRKVVSGESSFLDLPDRDRHHRPAPRDHHRELVPPRCQGSDI